MVSSHAFTTIRYPLIVSLLFSVLLISCKQDPEDTHRTYRMGFQNSSPRFDDINMAIRALNIWTTRSDAAMITTEVPWEKILNGMNPVDYVVDNYKDLVSFYRTKKLILWIYIDPQNGLDRTSDALELKAAGKSIADADAQMIYRRFVIVMDSVLKPEHLGLALETNLIRGASPVAIYNGVRQCVHDAAQDIRALHPDVKLSISVQAEQAWGRFSGSPYQGIDQDFADFPFIDELGISSYAYFAYDTPEEIPSDYYSRMINGKSIPVFISEGGWTSASLSTTLGDVESSPEIQQRYFVRQSQLLDDINAIAWLQLSFTDIDIGHLPSSVPENITYFAYLGLLDKDFNEKPAMATWDEVFKRQLLP